MKTTLFSFLLCFLLCNFVQGKSTSDTVVYKFSDQIKTLIQGADDGEHYYRAFDEVRINFQHYKLLENAKLLSSLESKVDDDSFEFGLVHFYKGVMFHIMDKEAEFAWEREALKEIISKLSDGQQKLILRFHINYLEIFHAETDGRDKDIFKIANNILDSTRLIKDKQYFYYFFRAKALNNRINYRIKNKDFDGAALDIAELPKNFAYLENKSYMKCNYYRTQGYLQSEQRKPEKAYPYYLLMLNKIYENRATLDAYYAYPMIAFSCYKIGDTEKSAKYLQLFKVTGDTIEAEKREAQKFLLADASSKKIAAKKQSTLNGILLAILVISGVTFIIYQLTRKKFVELPIPEPAISGGSQPQEKDTVSVSNLENLLELSKSDENVFYPKFIEIFPIFYGKLCDIEPKLSISEIKFCMYLKMKLSAKQIATSTNSTVKSVESKKYRLKKKLNLEQHEDVADFINSL